MSDDPQTPARLLVVDDDPAVAMLAQLALSEYGYRVRTVPTGHDALASIGDQRPDIILLDILMPGISGFDVCAQITRDPRTRTIPVVFVTSLDDPESIERAYEAGASAFVTKPINWPMLRHQLQYVLRASRDRARLTESEERYALAACGANDGLWDWNLASQQLYLSPRWFEQLGLSSSEIVGSMDDWLRRIHPDDRLAFRNALNTHLAGGSTQFETEYRVRDRSDDYRWMLCRALAIRDADGNTVRIAGSQTDITERKQADEQLIHDALHDALTGLPNRKLLLERIDHAIQLARRHQDYRFAVAVMDLDRFKNVNDSLGHLAGDSLLQRIASRITAQMRTSDTLARIGGDEFAILFDDTGNLFELERLIGRVLREVSTPHRLLEQDVVNTASLGVTVSGPGYASGEEMLRDADIAMYRAKATGKNCHQVFDSTMHTHVSELLQMENELRMAALNNQLKVFYQPIQRMDTGQIAGFEALLRWDHPRHGLISPETFMALAEETGLLLAIGPWVLRESTRQLARWHRELPSIRDAYVAVNLSSDEFIHDDLLQHVEKALAEAGLSPHYLRLEVTETVLIENTSRSRQVLEALRVIGVSTAIDDFGTGYSSFSYLDQLSFDALKIDRAFIHQIDRNAKRREIVRAMVTMAHNLDLSVIGEGGENQAEMRCLQDIGCEYHQGFGFAAALPADQISELVSRATKQRLSVVQG